MDILKAIKYMEDGNICLFEGYQYKIQGAEIYYKSKIDDHWESFNLSLRKIKSNDWKHWTIEIGTSGLTFEEAYRAMVKGFICGREGWLSHKIENGILYHREDFLYQWRECNCKPLDLEQDDWEIRGITTILHHEDEPMKLFMMPPRGTKCNFITIDDPYKPSKEISCTEALEAMNNGKTVYCLALKVFQRKKLGTIKYSEDNCTWHEPKIQTFTEREILSKWRIVE